MTRRPDVRVEVRDLRVSYRRMWGRDLALDGVSLEAEPGAVTAIIGRNGAGKSTLFRALLGFQAPDQGEILLGRLAPAEYRRRHGIGYVPETLTYPRGWTVAQILARGVDLSSDVADPGDALGRAMERANLGPEYFRKRVRRCSKGIQQRVKLAFALTGEPALVVLDEPFSNLDPPSRIALRDRIVETRARGATVLLASHDLSEVERLADRVYRIEAGRTEPLMPLEDGSERSWGALESSFEVERP